MPGKTPNKSGDKPVANGTRSKAAADKKAAKDKDGDEEMTVVVPPSKGTKQAKTPAADADGDVMDVDDEKEEEVDPTAQAIAGTR